MGRSELSAARNGAKRYTAYVITDAKGVAGSAGETAAHHDFVLVFVEVEQPCVAALVRPALQLPVYNYIPRFPSLPQRLS